MRGYPVAIISDVHANLEALTAVLKETEALGVKRVFFLGDAVGYGPDPDSCVEIIREQCQYAVAGNHDWAVLGLTPLDYFNTDAREAAEWTASVITEQTRQYLRSLPLSCSLSKEGLFLVHSTPKDPSAWNYILSLYDAEKNFQYFEERICFVGHSHRPFIIERLPSQEMVIHSESVRFRASCRYMINVGSVGQPRDGDPRACFLLLSEERAELRRVPYDLRVTQQKMKRQGLPQFLIQRLERGV